MRNKLVKTLLYVDSHDSIVRVLHSWRLWVVGAIIGALLASAIYLLFPPPYRAAAVVVIDHNLEEIWSVEQGNMFYFLGRETRKLEELAWSDETLQIVAERVGGITVRELREEILFISHPSDGGWKMYADHKSKDQAERIASTWAEVFVEQIYDNIEISAELMQVREEINEIVLANPGISQVDIQKLIDRISPLLFSTKGISPFIETYLSQSDQLTVTRSLSIAVYIISGSTIGALSIAFASLVLLRAEEQDEFLAD